MDTLIKFVKDNMKLKYKNGEFHIYLQHVGEQFIELLINGYTELIESYYGGSFNEIYDELAMFSNARDYLESSSIEYKEKLLWAESIIEESFIEIKLYKKRLLQ